jgi:long-chain acyl-CoA synthetase
MRNSSTLLHRLRLWGLDQPDAPALYSKDSDGSWLVLSAGEYWKGVVARALHLQALGIGPGERVVLYGPNSPEWVQWEAAIWLSGGISVGVHPQTSSHDLGLMIDQVDARLILVEGESFRERILMVRPVEDRIQLFSDAEFEEGAIDAAVEERLLAAIDPRACQLIIFTSGTTGTPKGVMLGLSQLGFAADTLAREWRLPYMGGHLFSFLPLAHVAEKLQTLGVALSQRYPVWFNSTMERFLPELREVRPTLLLAVPRVWERFKEQAEASKPRLLQRMMEFEKVGQLADRIYLAQVKEQLGLDRIELAVSGAAKLPPAVGAWFQSIGIEIREIYGMSESSGIITLTHGESKGFKSLGTPPVGVEVRVAIDGEIQVRGPNVFLGYWRDESGTREVLLEDGWLKTGDLGEWSDGLTIIGRNRDIIKLSSGRMVAPLPIENVLKEIPEVSNVCVVGEGKPTLMALMTLKEEILMELRFQPGAVEGLMVADEALNRKIALQIQDLLKKQKITERLGHFVVLSRDFQTDLQELTQTQKINRNQIQKSFRHFIELRYEEVPSL